MKKEYRLLKNTDFKKVLNAHHSAGTKGLTLCSIENNLDHARVGITISAKVGNAVERNKAKRQIRMMVGKIFDLNQSKDYVIIIKNEFKFKDYSENEKELEYLYKKISH